jgi:hypothetical protein
MLSTPALAFAALPESDRVGFFALQMLSVP